MTHPYSFRIGTGYDIHRLGEGHRLVLGGVEIQHTHGLIGHSDADAVCHAICDALLGAAALGDIGSHFPDTDPRYRGVSSLELLRSVGMMLEEEDYHISNLDITIHAERPKMRPHIERMRGVISGVLGLEQGRVSIKAKTNERMDAVGRGEAIAATAVALIYKQS